MELANTNRHLFNPVDDSKFDRMKISQLTQNLAHQKALLANSILDPRRTTRVEILTDGRLFH